jgi:hypothetical protein
MGKEKYIKILFGKPRGKKPFERLKFRWECNANMDLRVRSEDVNWVEVQDRVGLLATHRVQVEVIWVMTSCSVAVGCFGGL